MTVSLSDRREMKFKRVSSVLIAFSCLVAIKAFLSRSFFFLPYREGCTSGGKGEKATHSRQFPSAASGFKAVGVYRGDNVTSISFAFSIVARRRRRDGTVWHAFRFARGIFAREEKANQRLTAIYTKQGQGWRSGQRRGLRNVVAVVVA